MHKPPSIRVAATASGVCAAVFAGLMAWPWSRATWVRPLEYDEVVTKLIAQHEGFVGSLDAAAWGIDGHPPFLYQAVWIARHLPPGDPLSVRWASIISTVLAVGVLAMMLRRHISTWATISAGLLLAGHPTVLFQTVMGRTYTVMLLGFLLCVATADRMESDKRWLPAVFASGLLCGLTHHLGAGWPLMLAMVLVLLKRPWAPAVTLGLAGGLTACWNLYYALAQTEAWRTDNWLAFSPGVAFAALLGPLLSLGWVLPPVVGLVIGGRIGEQASELKLPQPLRPMLVTALASPVALIALSVVMPVMLDRYAIIFVAGAAGLLALVANTLSIRGQQLVALASVGSFGFALYQQVAGHRGETQNLHATRVQVDAHPDLPLFTDGTMWALRLCEMDPPFCDRLQVFAFDEPLFSERAPLDRMTQDWAEGMNHHWGTPSLKTFEADNLPDTFLLISAWGIAPEHIPTYKALLYPDYTAQHLTSRLFLMRRNQQ